MAGILADRNINRPTRGILKTPKRTPGSPALLPGKQTPRQTPRRSTQAHADRETLRRQRAQHPAVLHAKVTKRVGGPGSGCTRTKRVTASGSPGSKRVTGPTGGQKHTRRRDGWTPPRETRDAVSDTITLTQHFPRGQRAEGQEREGQETEGQRAEGQGTEGQRMERIEGQTAENQATEGQATEDEGLRGNEGQTAGPENQTAENQTTNNPSTGTGTGTGTDTGTATEDQRSGPQDSRTESQTRTDHTPTPSPTPTPTPTPPARSHPTFIDLCGAFKLHHPKPKLKLPFTASPPASVPGHRKRRIEVGTAPRPGIHADPQMIASNASRSKEAPQREKPARAASKRKRGPVTVTGHATAPYRQMQGVERVGMEGVEGAEWVEGVERMEGVEGMGGVEGVERVEWVEREGMEGEVSGVNPVDVQWGETALPGDTHRQGSGVGEGHAAGRVSGLTAAGPSRQASARQAGSGATPPAGRVSAPSQRHVSGPPRQPSGPWRQSSAPPRQPSAPSGPSGRLAPSGPSGRLAPGGPSGPSAPSAPAGLSVPSALAVLDTQSFVFGTSSQIAAESSPRVIRHIQRALAESEMDMDWGMALAGRPSGSALTDYPSGPALAGRDLGSALTDYPLGLYPSGPPHPSGPPDPSTNPPSPAVPDNPPSPAVPGNLPPGHQPRRTSGRGGPGKRLWAAARGNATGGVTGGADVDVGVDVGVIDVMDLTHSPARQNLTGNCPSRRSPSRHSPARRSPSRHSPSRQAPPRQSIRGYTTAGPLHGHTTAALHGHTTAGPLHEHATQTTHPPRADATLIDAGHGDTGAVDPSRADGDTWGVGKTGVRGVGMSGTGGKGGNGGSGGSEWAAAEPTIIRLGAATECTAAGSAITHAVQAASVSRPPQDTTEGSSASVHATTEGTATSVTRPSAAPRRTAVSGRTASSDTRFSAASESTAAVTRQPPATTEGQATSAIRPVQAGSSPRSGPAASATRSVHATTEGTASSVTRPSEWEMPDFKGYPTTHLTRDLKAFGFKPVKSRVTMINLLERCWKEQRARAGNTDAARVDTEVVSAEQAPRDPRHPEVLGQTSRDPEQIQAPRPARDPEQTQAPRPQASRPQASRSTARAQGRHATGGRPTARGTDTAGGDTPRVDARVRTSRQTARAGDAPSADHAQPQTTKRISPPISPLSTPTRRRYRGFVDVDEVFDSDAPSPSPSPSSPGRARRARLGSSGAPSSGPSTSARQSTPSSAPLLDPPSSPSAQITAAIRAQQSLVERERGRQGVPITTQTGSGDSTSPASPAANVGTAGTASGTSTSHSANSLNASGTSRTSGTDTTSATTAPSSAPPGTSHPTSSTLRNSTAPATSTAPGTFGASALTWWEKILLYDPIIIEDLTAWLNTTGLRLVGVDDEVPAYPTVKAWCEEHGVCCLGRENLRGGVRKRY